MKSDYQKFAEQYHKLPARPTTLKEEKDGASINQFAQTIHENNDDEDWIDGDKYFGVANA
jgi:hypothetical protein